MIKTNNRLVVLIFQIGIQLFESRCDEESLVADEAVTQRRNVEVVDSFVARLVLDFPPTEVELALEHVIIHPVGTLEKQLLDLRHRIDGLLTKRGRIDRNLSPADDPNRTVTQHALGNDLRLFLVLQIACRKKEDADGEIFLVRHFTTQGLGFREKNLVGKVGRYTRPITRLSIRIDRPTVGHIADRIESETKNPMAPNSLDMSYHPDPTGIPLRIGSVQGVFDFRTLQILTHSQIYFSCLVRGLRDLGFRLRRRRNFGIPRGKYAQLPCQGVPKFETPASLFRNFRKIPFLSRS